MKISKHVPSNHASAAIVSTVFSVLSALFAIWVVSNQFALASGISFSDLSIGYTILLIIALPFIIKTYYQEARDAATQFNNADRLALGLLFILAVIGSFLSVAAVRPDADDVNYVSRVVYFLSHPYTPLDLKFHDFWNPPVEMKSALKIFQTWTFLCGYIASFARIPFLDVYHIALPAMGGAAIPLAWFLAFSKFTNRVPAAVIAALAVCVFLALNGESHRSFGNFSFVRIWHSKAILLSIIVPLFTYLTLEYFQKPTLNNWMKLLLLQITCAGLSATAIFFMPFLGALLGASSWFKYQNPPKVFLLRLLAYFSSYGYLALLVAYILITFDRKRLEYIGNAGWDESFRGQFNFIFGNWGYPTAICVGTLVLLGFFAVAKNDRKFLISWFSLGILLFLNPVVFPFISSKVTSLNVYWRLFYLLPFPLVIGLGAITLTRLKGSEPKIIITAFILLMSLGTLGNAFFPERSTFGKLYFSPGAYKLDPDLVNDVEKIQEICPPGPMLAPVKYSVVIPLFTDQFPQVVVRALNLVSFAVPAGESESALTRVRAQQYVAGMRVDGAEDVEKMIKEGVMTIILDAKLSTRDEWTEISVLLDRYSFSLVTQSPRYFAYTIVP
jgi:ABC-type multidrug transport system fused ATPase/permease subunit